MANHEAGRGARRAQPARAAKALVLKNLAAQSHLSILMRVSCGSDAGHNPIFVPKREIGEKRNAVIHSAWKWISRKESA